MVDDCLFCSFVSGEIQPDVVHETDTTLAFRDIDPQAPTHVLVVPKEHYPDVATLSAEAPATLVAVLDAVREVADKEGLDGQFRLVLNSGAEAGQSVFHVHAHVLGGRQMGWPPG